MRFSTAAKLIKEYHVGMSVRARRADGKFYSAVVEKIHDNSTLQVYWPEFEQHSVQTANGGLLPQEAPRGTAYTQNKLVLIQGNLHVGEKSIGAKLVTDMKGMVVTDPLQQEDLVPEDVIAAIQGVALKGREAEVQAVRFRAATNQRPKVIPILIERAAGVHADILKARKASEAEAGVHLLEEDAASEVLKDVLADLFDKLKQDGSKPELMNEESVRQWLTITRPDRTASQIKGRAKQLLRPDYKQGFGAEAVDAECFERFLVAKARRSEAVVLRALAAFGYTKDVMEKIRDGEDVEIEPMMDLTAQEEEEEPEVIPKPPKPEPEPAEPTADPAADEADAPPAPPPDDLTPEGLPKLTVTEVRAALKRRELPTDGTKKVLLARLGEALEAEKKRAAEAAAKEEAKRKGDSDDEYEDVEFSKKKASKRY